MQPPCRKLKKKSYIFIYIYVSMPIKHVGPKVQKEEWNEYMIVTNKKGMFWSKIKTTINFIASAAKIGLAVMSDHVKTGLPLEQVFAVKRNGNAPTARPPRTGEGAPRRPCSGREKPRNGEGGLQSRGARTSARAPSRSLHGGGCEESQGPPPPGPAAAACHLSRPGERALGRPGAQARPSCCLPGAANPSPGPAA